MAYGAFLLRARAQGTSHAPSLTIREVRAIRLQDGFNSRFIRVYTKEGLTGTGEMVDSVGTEYIVNHNFNPALNGRDPLEIEGILFDFWGYETSIRGRLALCDLHAGPGGTLPHCRQRRGNGAVGLAGKACGCRSIICWADGCAASAGLSACGQSPEAPGIIDQTKMKALKVGIDYSPDGWTIKKGRSRPGLGSAYDHGPIGRRGQFRGVLPQGAGQRFEIALECHAHYDVETAIQLCHLLEPFRLIWVEGQAQSPVMTSTPW